MVIKGTSVVRACAAWFCVQVLSLGSNAVQMRREQAARPWQAEYANNAHRGMSFNFVWLRPLKG